MSDHYARSAFEARVAKLADELMAAHGRQAQIRATGSSVFLFAPNVLGLESRRLRHLGGASTERVRWMGQSKAKLRAVPSRSKLE